MRILEFPQAYRELYGAHCALMRLGFESKDIFVGFQHVVNFGPDVLYAKLDTQGKEFTLTITRLPDVTKEEVNRTWQAFIVALETATDDEIHQCWQESAFGSDVERLLVLASTISKRGLTVPALGPFPKAVMDQFGLDVPHLDQGSTEQN